MERLLAAIEALRADKSLAPGVADGIEAVFAGDAAGGARCQADGSSASHRRLCAAADGAGRQRRER